MDWYVGEIRMFAGNFAPQGWHICDGTLIPISENEVLYSLIGTTFGGNGQTTFALPDFRGRIVVHPQAGKYTVGQIGGTEQVTLTANQLPSHNHVANISNTYGNQQSNANGVWSNIEQFKAYSDSAVVENMSNDCIGFTGGNQPHNNIMPSLAINYIICLYGTYPPQPY